MSDIIIESKTDGINKVISLTLQHEMLIKIDNKEFLFPQGESNLLNPKGLKYSYEVKGDAIIFTELSDFSASDSTTETQSQSASTSPSPAATQSQSASASPSPATTQSQSASASPSPAAPQSQSASASPSPATTQSQSASASPSPAAPQSQSASASPSTTPTPNPKSYNLISDENGKIELVENTLPNDPQEIYADQKLIISYNGTVAIEEFNPTVESFSRLESLKNILTGQVKFNSKEDYRNKIKLETEKDNVAPALKFLCDMGSNTLKDMPEIKQLAKEVTGAKNEALAVKSFMNTVDHICKLVADNDQDFHVIDVQANESLECTVLGCEVN